MALTATELEADLAEISTDVSGSLAYSGQTVDATFGEVGRRDDVAPEGVLNLYELEATTALSDWTDSTPPDVRKVVAVTCSGLGLAAVNFHIVDRSIDPGGVQFRLRRV